MGELPFPKSLPEFQKLFPDDAHCAAYMERVRWPDGFVCPSCETKGEPGRVATRPHVLRCKACKKEARLTAGTVMQDYVEDGPGFCSLDDDVFRATLFLRSSVEVETIVFTVKLA